VHSSQDSSDLPATLNWAIRAIVAESIGLGLLAAYQVVAAILDPPGSWPGALMLIVFTILSAFGLWKVAAALRQRRGGVRGVAVAAELFLAVPGYYMLDSGLRGVGVLIMLLGLTTAGLLIAPATTRALDLVRGQ